MVDSPNNHDISDVIGNKDDTVAGNSLMSRMRASGGSEHQILYAGTVWYVSPTGNDSNTGSHPDDPFLTIGNALLVMASGDAVVITAGTYTEINLDLGTGATKNSLELLFELGAILDPASGTALTVSGNYCRVASEGGAVKITPGANETGVLVTGKFVYLNDIRVDCASTADIGFDIGLNADTTKGAGSVLTNCRCASPLVAAFKIQGDRVKIDDNCTGGEIADTSIGYWVTNSCDKVRISNSCSQGHSTAGYQVDTGCTNGIISHCISGAGDGDRIDNGTNVMWGDFQDLLRREHHEHIYPIPDGEGGAGDVIEVNTDANDKTNAAATTKDYWGEPMVILPPNTNTTRFEFEGYNIYGTTTNKIFRSCFYRIIANQVASLDVAGNAWDEGATVLTVDDSTGFAVNDLVWIVSSAHKPDGEIVRITDVTGNVITIEREISQFGAANTGLRWDHETNIGAGTLKMYLCWRDERQYHGSCFDFAAATLKDFARNIFEYPMGMNASDGIIVRTQNGTDGTNNTRYDISIIYQD